MQLLLPKSSLSEERISLVVQMRLVLPLQTAPCLLSLGRGQLRVFIDDMLMAIGYLLQDMHTVLTDDDTAKLRYLFLLQ